jgi:hypothetical protein
MSGDLVQFVRDRLDEGVDSARRTGNVLILHGAERLGVNPEAARRHAWASLHAAESRVRFFEETVVPYLGTAGPTGRIAEQQLRLLAAESAVHADYQPDWAPDPA